MIFIHYFCIFQKCCILLVSIIFFNCSTDYSTQFDFSKNHYQYWCFVLFNNVNIYNAASMYRIWRGNKKNLIYQGIRYTEVQFIYMIPVLLRFVETHNKVCTEVTGCNINASCWDRLPCTLFYKKIWYIEVFQQEL